MDLTFQEFFKLAMDRHVPELEPVHSNEIPKPSLNLGAGNKKIPGTIPLDLPEYDADSMPIPYDDGSIAEIFAFHFLEHCMEPVKVLLECQRVLEPGGIMFIAVPYGGSDIAFQDLDHKHFFTEETYKTLFKNKYYNKNQIEWKMGIGFNMICGIAHRNLVLLTQLIKE